MLLVAGLAAPLREQIARTSGDVDMIFQACLRAAVVAVGTGEQLKKGSYRNTGELLRCLVEDAASKKEGAPRHIRLQRKQVTNASNPRTTVRVLGIPIAAFSKLRSTASSQHSQAASRARCNGSEARALQSSEEPTFADIHISARGWMVHLGTVSTR